MSDTPRPIVICAQQRSGTTVLQENLGQSPLVTNFSEVFHNLEEISPVNYLLFRIEQYREDPALSFPTEDNQRILFDRYMEYLAAKSETPFYVMDIKYNSWHHFDTIWHGLFNRPSLVGLVRELDMPVIHVIRRDVFKQYVSNRFADKTQTWHHYASEDTKPNEIEIQIAPSKCQWAMEMSQRRTKQFRSWFHGHEKYIELTYEEMFNDGRFSEQTLAAINALIGVDLQIPTSPVLKKVLGSVSKVIGNSDEIVQYFQGTQFEKMVSSSLQPQQMAAGTDAA